MTQPNKTGMRLRQIPNPRKKDALWLMGMLTAMLGCAALILALTGLTGNEPAAMLIVGLWLCVAYGILRKMGRESWFYMGLLAILLVLSLVCREQVLEGFRILWNRTGDAMACGTGYVLPRWELRLAADQQKLCQTLFAGVAAGVLSLVCCALTGFAPGVLAVLLSATALGGMLLFGAEAEFVWLLPVLAVSVLVLLYSGWQKKGAAGAVVFSWIVCAVLSAGLLLVAVTPGMQNRAAQLRDQLRCRIHEETYETKYTTLPEGDFSGYTEMEQDAQPALAVTMQTPQQMYLRGFTAAVFTGDTWKLLDKQILADNQDLLYWLNLNAFDLNAQYDAAAAFTQLNQSAVTVENIGACSFYRYVPFSIAGGEWAQPENLNTDGVYGEGARGYSYTVNSGNSGDITQVLTQLQTSDDPGVLQYRNAESGYRQFVYQNYRQVPEEIKEMLQKQWDEIASAYGGAENLTLQQAQECTLIFLGRCFPEEGTPEEMELPLEIAEGSSFQYATVAAMTLRYFGIPARYAEGYVITSQMAAGYESGQTIQLDSACAKAWAEVYQDGIGWIPMALMPGMGELLEGEDRNQTVTGAQTPEEEPEEQPEEEPEPTGGTMVMVVLKGMLAGVLILLLAALLLLVALWIRRKRKLSRQAERFGQKNCMEAVAWIYADTALLLEKLGFDRKNGSMRSLQGPLEERFGAEFAQAFALVTDLNDRALFSSGPMDDTQRQTALKFHSWALRKLRSEVKWYRRLWLKWARCLY